MQIKEIITNKQIEITPKNMYKVIIIFGILCFISGCLMGYSITGYIIYERLCSVIYGNGILIFDDNYYKFIEIYPTINNFLN